MSAGILRFDDPVQVNNKSQDDLDLLSKSFDQIECGGESAGDVEVIESALFDPLSELSDDDSSGEEDTKIESRRGEKIIDILIPPSEWIDETGNRFLQRVSRVPPSRTDVIQLWEQLDLKLKERQARAAGICPIRRELYQEAFDELIRQVTLDCAERGLLLARVRDEALMTIAAFQSLLSSASEFGATKAIQAESGKSELEDELNNLEESVCNLEAENRRLEACSRQVARRARERREVQMTLFNEELECLQRSEQQYQILIETLLVGKSAA